MTIVTATAGGLLLLLLLVVTLVACQRRRIARNNPRNGHQRMNSDDDRYSFVYYSNDVHVVLPSYDEAMQTTRRTHPPPYIDGIASFFVHNNYLLRYKLPKNEMIFLDDVIVENNHALYYCLFVCVCFCFIRFIFAKL